MLKGLVVLFCSTYGDGGPTADSEPFYEWVMAEQSLTNVRYTVFALGNRTYENWCGMGVKVDRRL
jgi:NADPH-ferrihemoprotein reductase